MKNLIINLVLAFAVSAHAQQEQLQKSDVRFAKLKAAIEVIDRMPSGPDKSKLHDAIMAAIAAEKDVTELKKMVMNDALSQVRSQAEQIDQFDRLKLESEKLAREVERLNATIKSNSRSATSKEEVVQPSKVTTANVAEVVKAEAVKNYPGKYSVQEAVVAAELDAWKKIQYLKTNGRSGVPSEKLGAFIADAEKDYPLNFSTMLMVIESQVASYKKLQ